MKEFYYSIIYNLSLAIQILHQERSTKGQIYSSNNQNRSTKGQIYSSDNQERTTKGQISSSDN